MSNDWRQLNYSQAKLPQTPSVKQYTIATPPKTDIWRPDATKHTFDAPFIYRSVKALRFKSLRVTVSADWRTLYDQGGLMLAWPSSDNANDATSPPPHWVKAGIEHFQGAPQIGVVGTDNYSDWSLSPVPREGATKVRLEAVRKDTTLWVYLLLGNSERRALREIKWAFLDARGDQNQDLWLGFYAAKPTPVEGQENATIDVFFEDVEIESVI